MSSPAYFGSTQTNIDSTLRSDVKWEPELSDEGRSQPVSDVAEPLGGMARWPLEEIRAGSAVAEFACPADDPERPLLDIELTWVGRRALAVDGQEETLSRAFVAGQCAELPGS
jgi:hypothetical protein